MPTVVMATVLRAPVSIGDAVSRLRLGSLGVVIAYLRLMPRVIEAVTAMAQETARTMWRELSVHRPIATMAMFMGPVPVMGLEPATQAAFKKTVHPMAVITAAA